MKYWLFYLFYETLLFLATFLSFSDNFFFFFQFYIFQKTLFKRVDILRWSAFLYTDCPYFTMNSKKFNLKFYIEFYRTFIDAKLIFSNSILVIALLSFLSFDIDVILQKFLISIFIQ